MSTSERAAVRSSADQRTTSVIAIDGPSGSGKSTVARRVAQRLSLRYLDTGAMYRAITWRVLADGVSLTDPDRLARHLSTDWLEALGLEVGTAARRARIRVGGADVATGIRTEAVTAAVSAVAAVPAVRRWLVGRQRELIGTGGIVVEGRDIGTTVAPDATVKIFLTASGEARALRRHRQDTVTPASEGIGRTQQALELRDEMDSTRAISPLTQAPDAVEIDTTDLSVAQVVAAVLRHCAHAGITAPAAGSRREGGT